MISFLYLKNLSYKNEFESWLYNFKWHTITYFGFSTNNESKIF